MYSVFTLKIYTLANRFNAAATIKLTLIQLLHLIKLFLLVIYTDLKSLYKYLIKLGIM
jgi:hypothetical protein